MLRAADSSGNSTGPPAENFGKTGVAQHSRDTTNCCTPQEGQEAWDALKQQIKEHQLAAGDNACYRTKVGCLRICCHGPTMVVYPEGTWYHGMTAERIPQFVRQHLLDGQPVAEWIFARNPLGQSSTADGERSA